MNTLRRWYGVVLVALSSFVLAGCPVPVLKFNSGSCEMVKNAVPAFIEKGRTTKEDVLLGMGEPDGVGYAERWFAYGCIHGQGGAMLVLCAGGGCGSAGLQQVEYRRLIVTFDAANVVSEVVLETKTCTRTEGDIAGKDDLTEIPCLNVKGEDLL